MKIFLSSWWEERGGAEGQAGDGTPSVADGVTEERSENNESDDSAESSQN